MSYLNPLRLHFSGSFEAAVSTVNNDPVHYDSLDLGDYESVCANAKRLAFSFGLDAGDPDSMPVTRDLSAAKRETILRWLSEPGEDGRPLLGEPPKAGPGPASPWTASTVPASTVTASSVTASSVTASAGSQAGGAPPPDGGAPPRSGGKASAASRRPAARPAWEPR